MNAYVIMRNDVEIGYSTDEPICVLLENTYESRYKAMKQYFGVEQWAKDFSRDGYWSSEDGCTSYYIVPVELVTIKEDAYKVKITRDIHLDSQTQSSMGDIEI